MNYKTVKYFRRYGQLFVDLGGGFVFGVALSLSVFIYALDYLDRVM